MEFREFVKMLEGGGIMATQGVPFPQNTREWPAGRTWGPTPNCDPYNSVHCGSGASATTTTRRMKKMQKK